MDSARNETIIFYHLPKSAGTTLKVILRQNYAPEEIVECGQNTQEFLADLATWPAERLAAIRLIQGHFPYGLHEMLPRPTRCFTLLRDPVERVFSYYYHARREPAHYLYHHIHDNHWSLKELLDSGIALMMNDGQVRLMSGVWGDAPFGGVTEDMLATAVANLRACDVVGVTEQFDLTVLLLRRAFGWKRIHYRRENVGANRRRLDEHTVETIATVRRFNQLDQALYDEARGLLAAQAETAGVGLRLRLPFFRLVQALLEQRHKLERLRHSPTQIG